MPTFNGLLTPPTTDLRQGEQIALWSAESPAAGANSIVITRGIEPGANTGITFQLAGTGTYSVTINGSNTAPTSAGPTNGIVLATITTANAAYADTNSYTYYWGNVVSASSPVITLIAQR